MRLKNFYYYFQNAISPDLCNKIIDLGLKQKITEAKVLDNDKKARKSRSTGLDEQWIYEIVNPYLQEANEKSLWKFDVDWSETLQFTVYETDGFYDWHIDSGGDESFAYKDDRINFNNKIRKISMTMCLNNPKEYEGGELQFDFGRDGSGKKLDIITCDEIKSQGSMVFFPSFVPHRVTPVTKGTRYSLVMWTLGKPFK